MKVYQISEIRNITVLGKLGAGKTPILEAIL